MTQEELETEQNLREYRLYQKANLINPETAQREEYKPHPSAIKFGIACHICGGIRSGNKLRGERACTCQYTKEDYDWLDDRNLTLLYLCGKIDYELTQCCDNCHKSVGLWQSLGKDGKAHKDGERFCPYCDTKMNEKEFSEQKISI